MKVTAMIAGLFCVGCGGSKPAPVNHDDQKEAPGKALSCGTIDAVAQ
jgi:hypothetical protein